MHLNGIATKIVCFAPCFNKKEAANGVAIAKNIFSTIKNKIVTVSEYPISIYKYIGINNPTIDVANAAKPKNQYSCFS